jgi:hypothetical protein
VISWPWHELIVAGVSFWPASVTIFAFLMGVWVGAIAVSAMVGWYRR